MAKCVSAQLLEIRHCLRIATSRLPYMFICSCYNVYYDKVSYHDLRRPHLETESTVLLMG